MHDDENVRARSDTGLDVTNEYFVVYSRLPWGEVAAVSVIRFPQLE